MNDWLKWRTTGLGGSDSAVVLGHSPYKRAFQLWAEKTGQVEPPDLSGSEPVEWGTRLEDTVHEAYFEKTGRRVGQPYLGVTFPSGQVGLQHPDFKWMLATPDGFIDEYEPLPWENHVNRRFIGPGILEIKTTGSRNAHLWDDGPPLHYLVQLQHYLAVTGCEWGSFAVLIGGQEFRVFDVARDEELISDIIAFGGIFWEHVVEKKPVLLDGSMGAKDTVYKLHPESNSLSIELPEVCATYHEDLLGVQVDIRAMKVQLNELDEHKARLQNEIKMHIGDCEEGHIPGTNTIYRWKTSQRKAYTVAARSTRVLRAVKMGGQSGVAPPKAHQ